MSDYKNKSSNFGVGLAIGAFLGAVATFFLSPTSGEENRKMVAKKVKQLEELLEDSELDKKVKLIFGEVTEEATMLYKKSKKMLIKKLSELREAVTSIDKEKYETVVHDTVEILKKEAKKEGKEMEKLKEELSKEWKKLAAAKKK
ncbi:hypothetical protein COY90_01270 [Candidatus Roizmanbacteria bacterium CG_4_10_14_0_8_um_filter_39_9]|uniref:Gas vesicle protein n=1 Tax=Candidatus Roizmanbacteria bacterium CG_4_10_14_0_8_um_filter_39_9 TaxID=1974829 RepID=A0A2M7QDL4_9BACT|nr:MAG: hypothetical protein COY90_01270 [Candidatus Roizmanbacteria bacterium CG_4_10_14_0_8_um_filter_39_9]